MTLEEHMLNDAGKALANDIDREMLWSMLQGIGWHRVMIPRFVDNNHAIDITYWLEATCNKTYERNGRDFLFEDSKDANWFALRWGTV